MSFSRVIHVLSFLVCSSVQVRGDCDKIELATLREDCFNCYMEFGDGYGNKCQDVDGPCDLLSSYALHCEETGQLVGVECYLQCVEKVGYLQCVEEIGIKSEVCEKESHKQKKRNIRQKR